MFFNSKNALNTYVHILLPIKIKHKKHKTPKSGFVNVRYTILRAGHKKNSARYKGYLPLLPTKRLREPSKKTPVNCKYLKIPYSNPHKENKKMCLLHAHICPHI